MNDARGVSDGQPGGDRCPVPVWSEADRLAALDHYAILDTGKDPAFDGIAELAADILDAPIAVVNFIASDRQWFKAEIGIGQNELPLDVSICRHAILQSGVMVVPDLRQDPRFENNPLVNVADGLCFYAGALLETTGGLPLGTVCVLDRQPRPEGITRRQEHALRTLASQVMTLLELRHNTLLRERTEQHLGAVLESVSECFYALDSDWRFTVFNRASEEYFGVSRDLILGQKLWDIFPQGAGTQYEKRVRAAMDDRVPGSLVSPSLFRPGRFGDLRVAPMDGGGIAVSITDITEHKAAEDRLRESEHELQVLTDALPALISYVDDEERYRFVNKRYEEWFGCGRDEILGRHIRDVVGETAYNIAKPSIDRALAGERFTDERFMPYKDGGGREVSMDYVPRVATDGTREGYYVLIQDIAERKRTERELTELTATLEQRVTDAIAERETALAQLSEMQKMETIGQLSGGIAHDFNNLLTPIVGSLDMLHRKYHDDDRTARMLSGALQAAERARVLVSRLLTFARRQHLDAQAIDVASLAEGMVDMVQRTIGPQIEVVIDIPPGLPPAHVDPHQLELALLNMCVNARDAMPGGGTLTIAGDIVDETDSDRPILTEGRFVRLCVIDTGHGMDAETLRRATEPFYSTKGVGKGTGLGLSMVHGLAVQSGGGLHVASTSGEGTTVTIWLPVAQDAAIIPEDRPDFEDIAASRALSVLLVDDEELVLAGNAEMLESLGHRVTRVQSGTAALALLRSGEAFDVLLTDQMMPNMTGLELIAEAKSLRPDLPVALVTGFAGNQGSSDGIARLAKPFRLADLARFVDRIVPAVVADR